MFPQEPANESKDKRQHRCQRLRHHPEAQSADLLPGNAIKIMTSAKTLSISVSWRPSSRLYRSIWAGLIVIACHPQGIPSPTPGPEQGIDQCFSVSEYKCALQDCVLRAFDIDIKVPPTCRSAKSLRARMRPAYIFPGSGARFALFRQD